MKKKICIITGTRAEYGLLYWLMKLIQEDDTMELQIIATGMHLSTEFGLTYRMIENDGFRIDAKVEMVLSSDTVTGISKSIGLGLIGFADALSNLSPDVVVVLGDRYEIIAAAIAAVVHRIPIAHISGGEVTAGAIDEAFRHSISKMALLHFTATDTYRKRVIQLGEDPSRVFNVGAIGLDNIKRLRLLDREAFERKCHFQLQTINFLVTYHPVTLSKVPQANIAKNIVAALDHYPEAGIIFTQTNSDTDGREINQIFHTYVQQHSDRMVMIDTMGQLRYLSAMQYMSAVIGNSSSGIIEVPSFRIPTINIGERQAGRVMAPSVICCGETVECIRDAVEKARSQKFVDEISTMESPFGSGGVSEKIRDILRDYDFAENKIIKHFYDVDFNEFGDENGRLIGTAS